MIYVGSGQLRELLAGSRLNNVSRNDVLWGRRALRTRLPDVKSIFRRRVIYLDTVDVWRNKASGRLWVWWALSPYRIEKTITYFFLVIFAKKVIRLHVPAIVDSNAWRRLKTDDVGKSVNAPGFTYDSLIEFIEYIDSLDEPKRAYTSMQMFDLAKVEKMTVEIISVDADVNASKLLNGML